MAGGGRAGQRSVVAAVAVAVVALVAWWLAPGSSDSPSSDVTPTAATTSASGSSFGPSGMLVDNESGLELVSVDDLPAEAGDTLAAIDAGGPYRYRCCDDVVFRNSEGLLPDHERGYYCEYTVVTPGSPDRGPRRIVAGSAGELYYTGDHYASFERISR